MRPTRWKYHREFIVFGGSAKTHGCSLLRKGFLGPTAKMKPRQRQEACMQQAVKKLPGPNRAENTRQINRLTDNRPEFTLPPPSKLIIPFQFKHFNPILLQYYSSLIAIRGDGDPRAEAVQERFGHTEHFFKTCLIQIRLRRRPVVIF